MAAENRQTAAGKLQAAAKKLQADSGLHRIKEHPLLLTAFMMAAATICSFVFFFYVPSGSANIALFYVLALVVIARYTKGYRYGITAALFCVIFINYFFTYPHFKLNFTLAGYPVTFLVMLAIALITSTLTSHMKRQAEALAEAEKEKMRASLLRAVSHDLRTPLTSIIGSAAALRESSLVKEQPELQETASHIYDDAGWLLNMVENLLSITRIQGQDAHVRKSLEVVEEVVSESVTRLKKRLPQARIEVSLPDDFIMLPMDAMLIEQVLINLLENAVTHSKSSQPVLLRATARQASVLFEIIDYGVGISESLLASVFDGLPACESKSADSKKGMGIGLSICKTIVLAHGGTITARNHEGGAVFAFTLPLPECEPHA